MKQRGLGGGGGGGSGVGVGGAGVDHWSQLLLLMVASNLGPPSSVHVVEWRQEPPGGLKGGSVVSVGRSGRPQLAHEVVVMYACPRGPPLHCLKVDVERHHSPGPPVSPGPGMIMGNGAVVTTLPRKSGGVPVGFGTQ